MAHNFRHYGIAVMLFFAFINNVSAQAIKIEGPKEGTVGYRIKAKLTLDIDDPQIKCFPANDDWYAVQDLAGNKFIDFVPGRKSLKPEEKEKLFTFIAAGNKSGKTYLETWEVIIRPDDYVPTPTPDNEITKTELYKELLGAYQVSPSASSKATLTKIYRIFLDEVTSDKFKSFNEADASLKATTSKYISSTELRAVRDKVAEYLLSKVGPKGSSWDKVKLQAAMEQIVACLSAIPD